MANFNGFPLIDYASGVKFVSMHAGSVRVVFFIHVWCEQCRQVLETLTPILEEKSIPFVVIEADEFFYHALGSRVFFFDAENVRHIRDDVPDERSWREFLERKVLGNIHYQYPTQPNPPAPKKV